MWELIDKYMILPLCEKKEVLKVEVSKVDTNEDPEVDYYYVFVVRCHKSSKNLTEKA